eukprot:6470556-Lingulodinium_polyedra.AAC.1
MEVGPKRQHVFARNVRIRYQISSVAVHLVKGSETELERCSVKMPGDIQHGSLPQVLQPLVDGMV